MASNPIICCSVTPWGSTLHDMKRPEHTKTAGTFSPLERRRYVVPSQHSIPTIPKDRFLASRIARKTEICLSGSIVLSEFRRICNMWLWQ